MFSSLLSWFSRSLPVILSCLWILFVMLYGQQIAWILSNKLMSRTCWKTDHCIFLILLPNSSVSACRSWHYVMQSNCYSEEYIWYWSSLVGMCLDHHLHSVLSIRWSFSLHCMDGENEWIVHIGWLAIYRWNPFSVHIISTCRKSRWFLFLIFYCEVDHMVQQYLYSFLLRPECEDNIYVPQLYCWL